MKQTNLLFASLVIVAIILLSGCGVRTELPLPTSTPLPPPTSTPANTATRVPTETITPAPALTATWTPAPTLLPELQHEKLAELLSTNGGCDFPCWWGIHRGDPIEKAAVVTSPFGTADVRGKAHGYSISLGETPSSDLHITYYSDDAADIDRMVVNLLQPTRFLHLREVLEEQFSPGSILARYGKPSEVLFAAAPLAEPGPYRSYVVLLIYEEQDFGIAFRGFTKIDDPVRICRIDFRNVSPVVESLEEISLFLHDPKKDLDWLIQQHWNDLQPLGDVTNMSVESFPNAFSTPGSGECIESAVELWQ